MRVQELRIGNYYLDIDDELASMSGYELYQMTVKENTENLGVNEYRPIPLTEEWLLKFGFEISGSNVFLNQVYLKSKGLIEPFWYIYKYNYTYIEIKHVHQLQNLYFALTNKELKLKKI